MRQRARDVDPKGGVRRRSPLRRLTARSALRRRAQTNPARKSVLATGTHRRHRARRLIHTRVRRLSWAARATQTQLNQMRRLVKAGAGSNFRDNASAQVHTAPEASASSVTTAQPDSTGDRTGIPSLRGYEYTLLEGVAKSRPRRGRRACRQIASAPGATDRGALEVRRPSQYPINPGREDVSREMSRIFGRSWVGFWPHPLRGCLHSLP